MTLFIKKLTALVFAISVAAAYDASADGYRAVGDSREFLRELAEKTSQVRTIQTKFIQNKHLSVFSTDVKSSGRFFWQSPDKICLDYSSPAKYRIVINGDRIKTVNGGRSSTLSLKGNPVMDQMGALVSACMTGNLDALGNGFRYGVKESASEYLIDVSPVSETVRKYVVRMEIYLSRRDMSVTKLVMYENETDYTSYVFTEKKFNEAVPAAVFDMR